MSLDPSPASPFALPPPRRRLGPEDAPHAAELVLAVLLVMAGLAGSLIVLLLMR